MTRPARDLIDWSHTQKAEHDRTVKARRLANAARALNVDADGLTVGSTAARNAVRLHAGLPRKVSEETWFATCQLLTETDAAPQPAAPSPAPRRVRPCARCGATKDVRTYLNGPACPRHTPAALAGHQEPQAPPQRPRVARLTSRTAAVIAVEQDTRLQSAKRHAHTAAERARVGEHAHRLYSHLAPTAPP